MSLKKFFADKSIGTYFTLGIAALFLLTGILYLALFPTTPFYRSYASISITAVVCMFVGFALTIVLLVLKKNNLIPYIQGICGLLALLFFINASYYYVSVVMVGIDLDKGQYDPQFVTYVILFLISFVMPIVNIFLKQTKSIKEAENEQA